MAYCGNCFHLDVCKNADACDGRVPGCKHFASKKIVTNLDRFRVGSLEDVAEAVYCAADGLWCRNLPECGVLLDAEECIAEGKCIGCVKLWLQEPVEVQR